MPHLLALSNELLLEIFDWLESASDMNNMARSNRWLHSLLNQYLYKSKAAKERNWALYWAACANQTGTAKHCFKAGFDPRESKVYLLTPLSLVLHGVTSIRREDMVERGKDPYFKGNSHFRLSKWCQPPLFWASMNGNMEMVSLLLAREHENKDGVEESSSATEARLSYALLAAAIQGHTNIVRLLLSNSPIDPNWHNVAGQFTPLICTAAKGHFEVARMLLERGVDVNVSDAGGQTALHWAVKRGNLDHVLLLLNQPDLDPNLTDTLLRRRTPLMEAIVRGYWTAAEALLEDERTDLKITDYARSTALHLAAKHNRAGLVDLILQGGKIDPNYKGHDDRSPLHYAAKAGSLDAIRLLLASDAVDPNPKDVLDRTPLIVASCRDQEDAVELLIQDSRVDINARDFQDRSALYYAAESGHYHIVKLLLAAPGIRVDPQELAPLWPMIKLYPETAFLLREHGAGPAAPASFVIGIFE